MSSRDGEIDYLPHTESFLRSLVWQDTRLDLMRDVLAHPEHKPSLIELDFVNKFIEESELRLQLSILVEYGILKRVSYPGEPESETVPTVFYTLTDDGWAVVRYFNDQFSQDTYDKLSKLYNEAIEMSPPEVTAARYAPRPSGASSNN